MCANCMTAAASAGAVATGLRAWLVTRGFGWVTNRRLRAATTAMIAMAIAASATLSGTG